MKHWHLKHATVTAIQVFLIDLFNEIPHHMGIVDKNQLAVCSFYGFYACSATSDWRCFLEKGDH
jgi:hypothetical protein